jgi:hypothetical protein
MTKAVPGMAKRKKPKLFAKRCPECGSKNTKINWMRPKNYKKAALTAVDPLFGLFAGRYDRICLDCGHRFAP